MVWRAGVAVEGWIMATGAAFFALLGLMLVIQRFSRDGAD